MTKENDIIFPMEELPLVRAHNLSNDIFSKYYEVDDLCPSCGQAKWYATSLEASCSHTKIKLTPQRIHRCSSCGEIRQGRLKEKYKKIMEMSTKLLDTLRKISNNDEEWFSIIGNIYAKLGNAIHGEKMFQEILFHMKKQQFEG